METIARLVKGQASWWSPTEPDEDSVTALLKSRGVSFTNLEGWHNLDEYEKSLGEPHGRERIKVVDREEMLRVSER
jgi:ferredoxin--NADP+ reductase